MDIEFVTRLINAFGYVVYAVLGVLAVWGSYNVILLYRFLGRRAIRPADADRLLHQARELLRSTGGQAQPAIDFCQSPPHWHTALAQMAVVALALRDRGAARVKTALPLEFHTEVASPIERRLATISTIAKIGPLIGLLGTVLSMIEAFGRMGDGEKANPTDLASAISLGLWATAGGLFIATNLMVIGNDLHNRLRKLRDQTERRLPELFELAELAATPRPASPSRGGAGTAPAAAGRWS